jgi:hypothetical protein
MACTPLGGSFGASLAAFSSDDVGMYVLTEKGSSHEPPDLKKPRKEDHSHLLSPVLLCFTANVPAKGFLPQGRGIK